MSPGRARRILVALGVDEDSLESIDDDLELKHMVFRDLLRKLLLMLWSRRRWAGEMMEASSEEQKNARRDVSWFEGIQEMLATMDWNDEWSSLCDSTWCGVYACEGFSEQELTRSGSDASMNVAFGDGDLSHGRACALTVPASMWRGACAHKQRALLRLFRSLGRGPCRSRPRRKRNASASEAEGTAAEEVTDTSMLCSLCEGSGSCFVHDRPPHSVSSSRNELEERCRRSQNALVRDCGSHFAGMAGMCLPAAVAVLCPPERRSVFTRSLLSECVSADVGCGFGTRRSGCEFRAARHNLWAVDRVLRRMKMRLDVLGCASLASFYLRGSSSCSFLGDRSAPSLGQVLWPHVDAHVFIWRGRAIQRSHRKSASCFAGA